MDRRSKRKFKRVCLVPVKVAETPAPDVVSNVSTFAAPAVNPGGGPGTAPPAINIKEPDGTFVPIWVLPTTGAPGADSDFSVDLTVTQGHVPTHVPPDAFPPNNTKVNIYAIPDTAVTVPRGTVTFDGTVYTVRFTMHTTAVTTATLLEIRAEVDGQQDGQVVSNLQMVDNNASPITIQP